jgi:NCS1 family nucleobase:cation symporter-1
MLVAVIIQIDSPLVSFLNLIRLEALANIVAKAGILHLFFLFIPVWLLTALLYILFASMAGAKDKFLEKPEEQIPGETARNQETVEPVVLPDWATKPKKTDPVLWISAIIALLSLAACFVLPIWVYTTGGEDYQQNFQFFKKILIVPTLLYFVTGTVWAVKRNKVE